MPTQFICESIPNTIIPYTWFPSRRPLHANWSERKIDWVAASGWLQWIGTAMVTSEPIAVQFSTQQFCLRNHFRPLTAMRTTQASAGVVTKTTNMYTECDRRFFLNSLPPWFRVKGKLCVCLWSNAQFKCNKAPHWWPTAGRCLRSSFHRRTHTRHNS